MKILTYFSRAAVGRAVMAFGAVSVSIAAAATARADEQSITFNRHIRPILAENCYACHGPDKNKRESDLRLDKQYGAWPIWAATRPSFPASRKPARL